MRGKELSTAQEILLFHSVFYSLKSASKLVNQRKGGPPLFEERQTVALNFLFHLQLQTHTKIVHYAL